MMRLVSVGLFALCLLFSQLSYAESDELGYLPPPEPSLQHAPLRETESDVVLPSPYELCLKRSATALFNEKLMCATRQSLDDKIKMHGGVALVTQGRQQQVSRFDVHHLWPGSLYLSVAYVGTRFAVADIVYVDRLDVFDKLYDDMRRVFGKPTRVEGQTSTIKGIMWQQGDSIQVWLHRPRPGVLLVSYVRPDLYRYWTKPMVLQHLYMPK